jgi:DUF4097 and DUF4098 domain-containing protein YvlB
MRRRDVLILVLILLVGAGLTLRHKIREGQIPAGIRVDGLDFLQEPLYTFIESREAPLPDGAPVEIEAVRGDVEVVAWDQPKVAVEVRKHLRAPSEKEAAKSAESLRLRLDPAGGGLKVLVAPDPGSGRPDSLQTDFTVTVPRKARLRITTGEGGVQAHGLGGDVVIGASQGSVDAGEIGGACEVTNRNGEVTVVSVAGNVRIVNERDSVTVTGAGAKVEIEATHGDVSVTDARGDVRIRDDHGEVSVEGAGGSVEVEGPNSTVTLEKIAGAVKATVEGDPLEVREAGGPVTVQAEATSVLLADVRGGIVVTGNHTDVTLIRPGSDVEVRTTNQEIDLSVPPGRGFRVEAASESGEIESDLPALHLPGEPVSRFAGTVGDGSARYRLFTSHSTIRIRSEAPQQDS